MRIPPEKLIVTQTIRKATPADFKFFAKGKFLPSFGRVYCFWMEEFQTFSNWRAFNINTDMRNIAALLAEGLLYVQDGSNFNEENLDDFYMTESKILKELGEKFT